MNTGIKNSITNEEVKNNAICIFVIGMINGIIIIFIVKIIITSRRIHTNVPKRPTSYKIIAIKKAVNCP